MSWTVGGQPAAAFAMPPAVPPPWGAGTGVRGVLFSIVMGVGLVLGALVMAVVLLASGHPGAIAIGLVLAAVPVGPVIACYLWLDRFEPEPTRRGGLGLRWGGGRGGGGGWRASPRAPGRAPRGRSGAREGGRGPRGGRPPAGGGGGGTK